MAATLTITGLTVDTQEDAFNARVDALATELGLTAAQREIVRRTPRNGLHVLTRLATLADVAGEGAWPAAYRALSWYSEGASLERVVALLGVSRRPAQSAVVSGTAAGTAATVISAGARLQYTPTGSTWQVVSGAIIGGG